MSEFSQKIFNPATAIAVAITVLIWCGVVIATTYNDRRDAETAYRLTCEERGGVAVYGLDGIYNCVVKFTTVKDAVKLQRKEKR